MPKLARSLNQVVIVSCPAYFGDDAPRRLTLVDIEEAGLWFSGEALNAILSKQELTSPPDAAMAAVFLPFAQVSYLLDPRQFATPPRALRPAFSATSLPPPTKPARTGSARQTAARPALKTSKPTRPGRG